MPETIEITAYKFSELDDSAKEKAREWYREGALDFDWWDYIYEDADRVAEILGITLSRKSRNTPTIWFNGFYHQGSGSSFEGSYAYAKGAVKAIKEYAPNDIELHLIARDLQKAQRKNFYGLRAEVEPSNREISLRVRVENIHHIYGDATDEAEDAITEAMNDFNSWVFGRLEDEYEYLMSDEAVDENIEANEYLFDEGGNHI